mgnify:CR=1 FL=1
MHRCIKINSADNVAVAINHIGKGTVVIDGVSARNDIPQGHKIALEEIPEGSPIIRYGVILGYALQDIRKGDWVNENMLELPPTPDVTRMTFGTRAGWDFHHTPPKTTFEGYRNPKGGFAGTRNILAITTTVQCVAGVLNIAVDRIRREILPKYPNVDDVIPINHAYGCGVAIDAPDAVIPIRAIKNLLDNTNFGGEIMVVALGCEKLTVDRILGDQDNNGGNVIVLQELEGFDAMIRAVMEMAERKLARLNERRRETLPLSDLCIGIQCGGSDAFSGITSNPAAGFAADLLVKAGATVLFSEVTEVRDGVHILAERCVSEEVCKKLGNEMAWYDNYLNKGQVDRSANPTPGNKKGGLSNIVEKAMGSITKSGTSPIVEVLAPGEKPGRKGLIFAATPASDFVCGAMQLASGITLQVFTTGRGTPYGLAAAPVIKVSSRTSLKNIWNDLIDIDAGTIATGESTIEEKGMELFDYIVRVASGEARPAAEKYRIANDLCIFNPAPVT